ncbi:hypothetical protein [Echinicola salinicaeni]|uniref:hypothetical protein n=1 Tax=Echinicola salinicaeni TaxID=2762757 RepID=UPI00164896D3|nr:hypothetical protein [Echinicola salinicaeni]
MLLEQRRMKPNFLPAYGKKTFERNLMPLLDWIPMMQKEFDRVEKIIGNELKPEAAYYYYDFYDLAQIIKRKLLENPPIQVSDLIAAKAKLDFGTDVFPNYNREILWELLGAAVQIDQANHSYLENKIKDKTVLKLLTAIKNSFR